MRDTVARFLTNVWDVSARRAMQFILNPIADRMSSCMVSTAALVIKAGGSTLAKTGASAAYAFANGVGVRIAAATDMAALSGTVTNAKFNAYWFYVDSAGVLTSQMATEGATWAAVVHPEPPLNKAIVGYVRINPTGTGNFVGGTTALDDATVAPNAEYVSFVGQCDPTILLGASS